MTEGRVCWTYTCPICGGVFEYHAFAGKEIRVCKECQEKGEESK